MVDPLELLNSTLKYGGERYKGTKKNLIMFQVKAAICDVLSLLFDMRLDEHISIYLDLCREESDDHFNKGNVASSPYFKPMTLTRDDR